MENQQWISDTQQAVVMDLGKPGDFSVNSNGITPHIENEGNKGKVNDTKIIKDNVERTTQIQQAVEAAVSEISKKNIDNILEQIKVLTPTEHLLLYLKLPTECNNVGDPLRQPLNPLGSRSEISQTIMWIKTHLEEDPELSLPKQDVYNEYYAFCGPNKIKPLSTADFGKVMKQVYPKVRPRRLGTRGNSRYCYAGLRRRLKLDSPLLPDLSDKPQSSEVPCSSADLVAAAWTIVKEWSEHQLGAQFSSLQALACYLVLNISVGNGTTAANLVTSVARNPYKGEPLTPTVCTNKHRETQLQLQRKIQQKNEFNREQKRKMQLQSPKVEPKLRSKKCKLQSHSTSSSLNSSPTTPVMGDIEASPSGALQSVCDKPIEINNLPVLPNFSSFQKSVSDDISEYGDVYKQNSNDNMSDTVPKPNALGKLPLPRLNSSLSKFPPATSPKRAKSTKYKAIQPKPELCDSGTYNSQIPTTSVDFRSHQIHSSNRNDKNIKDSKKPVQNTFKTEIDSSLTSLAVDGSEIDFPRERLISIGDIDKSALDDYLGANNSQEQEEELVKYFENKDKIPEQDVSVKLTQLRQLLITQQNINLDLNSQVNNNDNINNSLLSSSTSAFTKTSYKKGSSISNLSMPLQRTSESSLSANNISARRRVSFEILQDEAVPPSPNTRRKNFNFTPISPGPLSPNGRQSKCSSTTASPFVSPRNTPVPRCKGSMYNSFVINPNTSVGLPNITSARKSNSGFKNSVKIKQEADTHNENDKLNYPVNEEIQNPLLISTDIANYLPMSAPASPKLPLKGKNSNLLQKLLNSNKVACAPTYTRSQSTNMQDSLSSEISQLFSANVTQTNMDAGYRSQSVPLHQMSVNSNGNIHSPIIQNTITPQFSFMNTSSNQNIDAAPILSNEFSDFDTFSTNENINMNKILNTLEGCPNDAVPSTPITGVSNITTSLNKNMNLPLEENFDSECSNFTQHDSQVNVLPNSRSLGRSQSIDIDITSDIDYSLKYNPSRSVPGTPIPSSNSKIYAAKNYRSYPSTPLAVNETFSYNHSQDYLLNGQPIKENRIEINQNLQFYQNSENNDEIYNVDMFNINDSNLNCDILGDKNNFNFDSQIPEGNFCAKPNLSTVLGDNCMEGGNQFDFKSTRNINGT